MCWTLTHALPQIISFYSKRFFASVFMNSMTFLTNIYSICSKQIFKNIANISKWKGRYMVWLTWPPTISLIRHWVVSWRANRPKDELTRDWTVHGSWQLCFGSKTLSAWCTEEKRARLPSSSFETLWVDGGELFKGTCCEYRKWQVTLD